MHKHKTLIIIAICLTAFALANEQPPITSELINPYDLYQVAPFAD